jgi:hypothetical protein
MMEGRKTMAEDKFDSEHKSVNGKPVHRADFAYVGDPKDKSTWKLPVDAGNVEAALDLFARTELPAGAKQEVASRIAAAAARHGVDKDKLARFRARYLAGAAEKASEFPLPRFVIRLSDFAGTGLIRIPIAITGQWVRGASNFAIGLDDLNEVRENFAKKPNGEINVDYDHASEMPEVAAGGPVPSAGRIVRLDAPEAWNGTGQRILWGW